MNCFSLLIIDFSCWFEIQFLDQKSLYYLPDLVMIISVPSSWNLSHSSLVSRLQEILAISSLGMPGLVGMSGSVHTAGALPLKSPCASREERSARGGWLHEDFSTNCSVWFKRRQKHFVLFYFFIFVTKTAENKFTAV